MSSRLATIKYNDLMNNYDESLNLGYNFSINDLINSSGFSAKTSRIAINTQNHNWNSITQIKYTPKARNYLNVYDENNQTSYELPCFLVQTNQKNYLLLDFYIWTNYQPTEQKQGLTNVNLNYIYETNDLTQMKSNIFSTRLINYNSNFSFTQKSLNYLSTNIPQQDIENISIDPQLYIQNPHQGNTSLNNVAYELQKYRISTYNSNYFNDSIYRENIENDNFITLLGRNATFGDTELNSFNLYKNTNGYLDNFLFEGYYTTTKPTLINLEYGSDLNKSEPITRYKNNYAGWGIFNSNLNTVQQLGNEHDIDHFAFQLNNNLHLDIQNTKLNLNLDYKGIYLPQSSYFTYELKSDIGTYVTSSFTSPGEYHYVINNNDFNVPREAQQQFMSKFGNYFFNTLDTENINNTISKYYVNDFEKDTNSFQLYGIGFEYNSIKDYLYEPEYLETLMMTNIYDDSFSAISDIQILGISASAIMSMFILISLLIFILKRESI